MNDPMLHPTAGQLQDFAENLLDGGDRAVLESHLPGCANCQSEVEEWRSLFHLLATMPQHAPSLRFADRVMAHVTLPDPWYVRAAARAGSQIQVFVPKTTRGWAYATAFMTLPLAIFGALAMWILSKPYISAQSIAAFAIDRTQSVMTTGAQGVVATILQNEVTLFFARGLETVSNAGAGAAGVLAAGIAMAIALSAWVLYQNLFRTTTTRGNNNYVSYSF